MAASPSPLRLTVAYDGTDFCGYQAQPGHRTVQGVLEGALERLLKVRPALVAAGRTDAGVHALGQVVSLLPSRALPLQAYTAGLNSLLPRDVAIQEAEAVPPSFSARFSAYSKIYRYTLYNAPLRSPLEERRAWHIRRPLEGEIMNRVMQHLVGIHDFASFRAAGCSSHTPVRHLFRAGCWREGPHVFVEVEGTAFLRQMVRIIVGTLVEVGRGRLGGDAFRRILGARDRRAAGPTAPPQGLCLMEVRYPRGYEPRRRG